ncbi:MAG: AbrB/MazE/SpoVT family DNA-binding domain-containing protein [Methylocystis sp.]|jgi:putative addiction module antidote|nr:AbrB/MazE/SpoVT family DNA-binding domain-containing protein [Methylocystis sp.]MCA3585514.1 AbrB/MazE/SpoVT family DNA-binding domain-containing protein [Methylocystis sp.]MCA3588762.1 AbrB/MazE/SpoVT family DNA-binding domain-containing protein [Methylocystis sp.]MCA3590303.1 AbrB/MazE/SpoVT family DNA-binding domain-containing protein [Methylocystis sp.]
MNKRTEIPKDQDFTTLKIVQIGNSLGVVLPRDVLDELNVEKGDKLFITRSPEGYRFTRNDPEFERRMALARDIMRRRHNVLRELAK